MKAYAEAAWPKKLNKQMDGQTDTFEILAQLKLRRKLHICYTLLGNFLQGINFQKADLFLQVESFKKASQMKFLLTIINNFSLLVYIH